MLVIFLQSLCHSRRWKAINNAMEIALSSNDKASCSHLRAWKTLEVIWHTLDAWICMSPCFFLYFSAVFSHESKNYPGKIPCLVVLPIFSQVFPGQTTPTNSNPMDGASGKGNDRPCFLVKTLRLAASSVGAPEIPWPGAFGEKFPLNSVDDPVIQNKLLKAFNKNWGVSPRWI